MSVAIALAWLSGCGPALETSDQAVALPALERDPAEDGADLGRWPGWRGRNASGVAPGGAPALHFSDTEGFRWKVAVPGKGNSSPVVWDNFVLLTTATDDTDPPTLAVLCFDRIDGKLLWQVKAGEAHGPTHLKNGHASATVATDGERIFAFFGSAGLFCCDFGGKRLWHADLGDLSHQWGTASSPVFYGDTVIQLCDCEGDCYVAAFDKADGRRVWRTERPSQGSWSTPVFVEVDAGGARRTEMIVNGTTIKPSGAGLVIAYDPETGRELWRVRGTNDLVTPTPVVCHGLVLCASGRNGPIMAIRPGGSGDVTDTRVAWKATAGGPYIPSGVAYRNRLYLVRDDGRLTCYNAGSGERIWGAKLPGAYSASLLAADGRIYAVSEQGGVSAFAAADSFELLARSQLHAVCYATPAVADGELLIRTESDLYCIAPTRATSPPGAASAGRTSSPRPVGRTSSPRPVGRTSSAPTTERFPDAPSEHPTSPAGEAETPSAGDSWPLFRGNAEATGVASGSLPEKLDLLWTFSADKGGFEAGAAIVGGVVYVGGTGGKLFAVDLASGRKRWEFPTELGFMASPAVRNGLIYIGDSDGTFYCIDAKSGKPQWKFSTQVEIDSAANFYKENVLFGSQDASLYCLKADTGDLVWKYESPDQIRCSPAVVGDRAFVAGCDGRLHVVDLVQGRSIAEVELEGPTGATPAILGDAAFVGTENGTFFGVDWKRAKVLWKYTNPEHAAPYRSSAAATPTAVIVGSRDKRVRALDPRSGEVLWSFVTKSRVDSSPVVVGGRVFVGSADGRLYALDLNGGRELWSFEAGGALVASPAVAAGRLVIGNDNGDLYCFGAKQADNDE